ncbi:MULTISPECIES: hypothetical protein [Bacteroidales]|jgi:hypothetical protein|uniref:hypothetical protein n=1 Tax=Bacteroidales TaxID=171549 RepID=UPI002AAFF903|nr:hypothetical protein [Bacteroidaceae bacterium]
MKIFKLMAIALVAMLGFTACDKDCDHEFIEHDHSADLVGTWTCLTENYAEALIIKADGTAVSYGVEDGKYWENVKGTVTVKENNITMIFEDDDNWTGHFDVIPGMAFSLFEENGERYIYQYCANDLSDEIVGMWVCTYVPWMEADMAINVYQADGKAFFTGFVGDADFDYASNVETTYKVIGDLMFQSNPMSYEGAPKYLAFRMNYSPNGSEYGDVLTNTNIMAFGDETIETTASMIRIRQSLDLTGKVYDYKSAYVTNAKGKDEDFSIMGNIFNIANINAGDFDIILGSTLFCVELNANSIKHKYILNGQDKVFDAPITVDGNKVTLDMSAVNPALRKVEMYMYQDADDSQLHMYMHTDAFINYFANLEVVTLIAEGKINQTDEAAIAKVFADMEARVESINVSFVMTKAAK